MSLDLWEKSPVISVSQVRFNGLDTSSGVSRVHRSFPLPWYRFLFSCGIIQISAEIIEGQRGQFIPGIKGISLFFSDRVFLFRYFLNLGGGSGIIGSLLFIIPFIFFWVIHYSLFSFLDIHYSVNANRIILYSECLNPKINIPYSFYFRGRYSLFIIPLPPPTKSPFKGFVMLKRNKAIIQERAVCKLAHINCEILAFWILISAQDKN